MHTKGIIVLDRITMGQMLEKIAIKIKDIETLQLLSETGAGGETRCEIIMKSGQAIKVQHEINEILALNDALLARFEP